MPTICLAMIVKNEAHVIERALRSALPYIDHWVICDTGSTDGTPDKILQTMGEVPGQLFYREWVNFGHNREEVLKLCGTLCDYILILDADLVLNVYDPEFKSRLTADAYDIRYQGNLDYVNTRLVTSLLPWRYIGVTHEYIMSPANPKIEELANVGLLDFSDGGNRGDKFQRDIRLLNDAVLKDPSNSRNVFYLAQSYRDAGQIGEALFWYERRAGMGGWDEEVWYAMFMKAMMLQKIRVNWSQVQEAYLEAYRFRPSRIEPLYEVSRHLRLEGENHMALLYSAIGMLGVPYPKDKLFIDRYVYEAGFEMEFTLARQAMGERLVPA
jgi:glycosyltransferase involved in cell wall biosynthesis